MFVWLVVCGVEEAVLVEGIVVVVVVMVSAVVVGLVVVITTLRVGVGVVACVGTPVISVNK